MDTTTEPARRARGFLESDVKRVCDSYVKGEFLLDAGQSLTPHRIRNRITEVDALDKKPSAGAVFLVLQRWEKYGAITVLDAPYAFEAWTEACYQEGIDALRKAWRKANGKAEPAESEPEVAAATESEPEVAEAAPAATESEPEAEAEQGDTLDSLLAGDTGAPFGSLSL